MIQILQKVEYTLVHHRNQIEFFANMSLILGPHECISAQLAYLIIYINLQLQDAILHTQVATHSKLRNSGHVWCVLHNLLDIFQAINPKKKNMIIISKMQYLVDIDGIAARQVQRTKE